MDLIKLFVLDLDGCVTEPFQTPDWKALSELRRLNEQAEHDETIPALSICTGRPQPYAEAVAQWLGMQKPLIFESGAGMWFPKEVALAWNPAISETHIQRIEEMRQWMHTQLKNEFPGLTVEFTKHCDAGVLHPDSAVNAKMYEHIVGHTATFGNLFEVHNTDISVNVLIRGINKGSGLRWLSKQTGIAMQGMAYIGDSSGDLSALEIVGRPFTPRNGIDQAKAIAEVTEEKNTWGVVEAYKKIIESNRHH